MKQKQMFDFLDTMVFQGVLKLQPPIISGGSLPTHCSTCLPLLIGEKYSVMVKL